MNVTPRVILSSLLIIGLTSCAAKKGAKRHKRPSGGSGNGCDCPGFGHGSEEDALTIDRFPERTA